MFKKKSNNGFMDFCFHQQKMNPSLSRASTAQLVEKCSPIWEALTPGEKSNFKRGNQRGGVYRGLGAGSQPHQQPISPAERERAEQRKLDLMMKEIKETVSSGLLDGSLETKLFYVISTSVFCVTDEKQIVPAEISLAKFSLKDGVVGTYQELVHPGDIPRGYLADCVLNSSATHHIPVDHHGLCGDYNKILEEILIFLMENEANDDILPPLYCNPKQFKQNSMFLNWVQEKASSNLMDGTQFQFSSLPALLYELCKPGEVTEGESSSQPEGRRNLVPSLVVAESQLGRNTFMYLTQTCELHSEGQPGRYYCCQANVLGWSYILLSLVCPLYSIPLLEYSHWPEGYHNPQLARSRVKSSLSQSDILLSNRSSTAPSTTSSVFAGFEESNEDGGIRSGGSGVTQISAASSSYKQGSYSRTGSLASQNNIFVYLAGKGRGVSHQGRVLPMSRLSDLSQVDGSTLTSLDITSDKSYLGSLN